MHKLHCFVWRNKCKWSFREPLVWQWHWHWQLNSKPIDLSTLLSCAHFQHANYIIFLKTQVEKMMLKSQRWKCNQKKCSSIELICDEFLSFLSFFFLQITAQYSIQPPLSLEFFLRCSSPTWNYASFFFSLVLSFMHLLCTVPRQDKVGNNFASLACKAK